MATKIHKRFVFDSYFFEELFKTDLERWSNVVSQLSYITSKASGNKRRQNIISNQSRNLLITKIPTLNIDAAKIFLNILSDAPESIERIDDEVTRTLKYAIHLMSEWPNEVQIFTSTDKIRAYSSNEHYQQHFKAITLTTGETALSSIEFWFAKCRAERNSTCDSF